MLKIEQQQKKQIKIDTAFNSTFIEISFAH